MEDSESEEELDSSSEETSVLALRDLLRVGFLSTLEGAIVSSVLILTSNDVVQSAKNKVKVAVMK